jgi:hypothetical protein
MNISENLIYNIEEYTINMIKELERNNLLNKYNKSNLYSKNITQNEIKETFNLHLQKVKGIINSYSPRLSICRNSNFSILKNLNNDPDINFLEKKRKRSESNHSSTARQTPNDNLDLNEQLKSYCTKVNFPYELNEIFFERLGTQVSCLEISKSNFFELNVEIFKLLNEDGKNLLFVLKANKFTQNEFFALLKRHFAEGGYTYFQRNDEILFGGRWVGNTLSYKLFDELKVFFQSKDDYLLSISEYWYMEDIINLMPWGRKLFKMKEYKDTSFQVLKIQEIIKKHNESLNLL